MPEVSIITALHNCVDLTKNYVESLVKYTRDTDWELILIDDTSTDGTLQYLQSIENQPRIHWMRNSTNLGFSGSNNVGAGVAKGEFLAFLNNDLELTQDWLPPMLERIRESEVVGAVGNVQINPLTGKIDHAGVFFGLDGMPRQARKNRTHPPATDYTEWNAVTAACMLTRAKVFQDQGGFDEAYRNGFEDIDYCVRLRQKGYHHYVANKSRIYHHVSASPGRHQYNEANSAHFRNRHADYARQWGLREWAPEYLERYAEQWWRFNLGKWCKAQSQLLRDLSRKRLVYRR